MEKIIIFGVSGYSGQLGNIVLPIVVNAKRAYEGAYSVFAEEFRGQITNERLPDSNDGKGLSFSFYDTGKYKVLSV
jgi:hypothetical protein